MSDDKQRPLRKSTEAYYESLKYIRGPWALSSCLRTHLAIDQSSRSTTYILSFYPRGSKLTLFLLYGQQFPRYEAIFKLPYLAMKLCHWTKLQKLHIYSLSTLGDRNWVYFRSMGSSFRDMGQFSKLPYLGMKLCHWRKFHKLHMLPKLPSSPKFHSTWLYGWPFPRY